MALPGYAKLFEHLFEQQTALAIASRCESPAKLIELGRVGLSQYLQENNVRHQLRTIDKVLCWASQTPTDSIKDGPLHHAIWTDLYALYQQFRF